MLITQLGFGFMTPVFLCIFLGTYLDSRYGTRLFLIFLTLGFLAGGRNGWMMLKSVSEAGESQGKGEEHEEE